MSTAEQDQASCVEWPFFNWVAAVLHRGDARALNNEPLSVDDLLELPIIENPQYNAELIQKHWEEELAMNPSDPQLMRAIRRAYWPRVLVGAIFRLISDGSAFASPFMLREYIKWLNNPTAQPWVGYVWAVGIGLLNVVMSLTLNAASHHTLTAFNQMRVGLAILVFNASLNLKNNHDKSGMVIAAHAADTAKFLELGMFVHGMWISPILVIAAIISLYFFIGYAGLIVVGVMFITTPLQGVLMGRVWLLRGALVKLIDKRVQAIDEVLQGIRICKFMGWEVPFAERIAAARSNELVVVAGMYTARLVAMAVMTALPTVLTICLFGVAYAFDPNLINTSNVFPAMSMLSVIRIPLMFIPMAFAKLAETNISAGRIQSLLSNRDRKIYTTREARPEKGSTAPSIEVRDAVVEGDGGKEINEAFNVSFPTGKLTIITGPTGSGKSALIGTVVGEAPLKTGSVTIRGTTAFVPQDAWIMNATVKGNILMGKAYDHEKYVDALLACQLMSDLEQLPGSDGTEIGERGINLSGGQKQRIAFARAVYAERDIVIMDDPLSAVDPHVCHSLVHECILGALKNATRLLVTHQVQFLPHAEHIVCLDNCKIVFQGSYMEYVKYQSTKANADGSPSGSRSPRKSSTPQPEGHVPPPRDRTIPPPRENKLLSKEEVKYGDVDWSTYGWYIALGSVVLFALIIIASILTQAALVIDNLILAAWSNRTPVAGAKFTNNDYMMWFGIFGAISIVLSVLRQKFFNVFALSVADQVHNALVVNVLRAPVSFFDVTPLGRIMNRFTKDIEVVDNNIPESIGMMLNLLFAILGTVFLVCFSAPYLLALMPFVAAFFIYVYRFYARTTRGVKRLEGTTRSPQMAIMAETLGGLSTIRAYNMQDQFMHTHLDRAINAARAPYNMRSCQRWLSARTELVGNTVLLATCLLGAVTATNSGSAAVVSQSSGVIALSITFAIATTNAVTFLTRTMADLESDMSATERVKEYSDSIPQERVTVYGSGPDEQPNLDPAWPRTGTVEFKAVELRYRDGLPLVLKGVSFRVESGQKVGVVGRTGSGKSTIMLALFRMVELATGRIDIDGRDIASINLPDLRKHITIIPQDPLLFAGTIKTNLDPFGMRSDEELWAAIDRVNMRTRLIEGVEKDQPNGLDAPVSAKGSNFSVGQRQLLCLARALLKKSRILLLDEATASVDFEADAMIQTTIRTQFYHCTVLTIAHRLATVIDADRVLVLGDGNVLEYGEPSTLLATTGSHLRDMGEQLGPEQFASLQEIAARAASKNAKDV